MTDEETKTDTIDSQDARYERGARAALVRVLETVAGELGYYGMSADLTKDTTLPRAKWIVERERIVASLRAVCEVFGDNDWPEDLYIPDVIEKHLMRPLCHAEDEEIQRVSKANQLLRTVQFKRIHEEAPVDEDRRIRIRDLENALHEAVRWLVAASRCIEAPAVRNAGFDWTLVVANLRSAATKAADALAIPTDTSEPEPDYLRAFHLAPGEKNTTLVPIVPTTGMLAERDLRIARLRSALSNVVEHIAIAESGPGSPSIKELGRKFSKSWQALINEAPEEHARVAILRTDFDKLLGQREKIAHELETVGEHAAAHIVRRRSL